LSVKFSVWLQVVVLSDAVTEGNNDQ